MLFDDEMDQIADNNSGTPENNKAKHSSCHVRKVPISEFKPEPEFKPIENAVMNIRIKEKKPQMFFGFYITSFSSRNKSSALAIHAFFLDHEKEEARNIFGYATQGSLSGAFAEQIDNTKKEVSFSLKYRNKGDLSGVKMENEMDNISIGGILMENGKVFRQTNNTKLTIKNTPSWLKINNFKLNLLVGDDKSTNYIIFYNFACDKISQSTIWTRIRIDEVSKIVIFLLRIPPLYLVHHSSQEATML